HLDPQRLAFLHFAIEPVLQFALVLLVFEALGDIRTYQHVMGDVPAVVSYGSDEDAGPEYGAVFASGTQFGARFTSGAHGLINLLELHRAADCVDERTGTLAEHFIRLIAIVLEHRPVGE